MKMKHIAVAVAFAFTSGMAVAADNTQQQRGVSDGTPKGNPAATEYWTNHSKEGYMTREQAMSYKGKDGKPMDWKRLNTDTDDRISEAEWTAYHSPGATQSDGSKDHGANDRSGAAGRTGSGAEAGVSSGGGAEAGVSTGGAGSANPGQPKDSDPTSGGRGSN